MKRKLLTILALAVMIIATSCATMKGNGTGCAYTRGMVGYGAR
jgi:predicted small secreted protein